MDEKMTLKSLIPLILTPLVTWILSTYSFTEIMKVRMDAATNERSAISKQLDEVSDKQGNHETRITVLEGGQAELKGKVEKMEEKVYDK